jgi:hypothetical protein
VVLFEGDVGMDKTGENGSLLSGETSAFVAARNESHKNGGKRKRNDATLLDGWEVMLGPGDALYIPKHVWHQVTSLSNSISVSFWVNVSGRNP